MCDFVEKTQQSILYQYKSTALILAAENGSGEIVSSLLSCSNIDINHQNQVSVVFFFTQINKSQW